MNPGVCFPRKKNKKKTQLQQASKERSNIAVSYRLAAFTDSSYHLACALPSLFRLCMDNCLNCKSESDWSKTCDLEGDGARVQHMCLHVKFVLCFLYSVPSQERQHSNRTGGVCGVCVCVVCVVCVCVCAWCVCVCRDVGIPEE